MVFIDGQLVDAREIPAVQRVVEAIRQEMAAAQEVVTKSLEQAEGDQEVSLVESESELESESGQVDSLEADQAVTAEVLSADSDQLKYQNLSEQEQEALKRLQ